MATPERVADAVRAMRLASMIPITVMHRFGIDGLDNISSKFIIFYQ
jgi:tRNA-dihydrouridine synthase